jgi:tripartite-type tricarboxylate transporter receptor subunit TctC
MRVCLAVLALGSASAWSQSYPSRPIRLVVPFAPGGAVDTYARMVAKQVEAQMGQPIVIDNRSGANGIVAGEIVARAPPDGYTLLNHAVSFVINPAMYKAIPYDTERDFAPITNFVKGSGYFLTLHPVVPATSVKELIALARKKDESLRYSSPGIGNGQHLVAELLAQKTGVRLLHVTYKGSNPALQAVLSGEVNLSFQTPTSVIGHIKAGRLRALGFTGPTRLPVLPDVPTIAEAGVPGFLYEVAWHAWFAPAKTSAAIVDRLHTEVRKAVFQPKLQEFFQAGGFEPQADPPAEFLKVFRADMKRYGEIVRLAKIEPQ